MSILGQSWRLESRLIPQKNKHPKIANPEQAEGNRDFPTLLFTFDISSNRTEPLGRQPTPMRSQVTIKLCTLKLFLMYLPHPFRLLSLISLE